MGKMVHAKTLYQQVVDYIKEGIARGVYAKGELLPSERVLMERLGVGRVTVREGLRILSQAGVIRTVKGKGSFVAVDWQDLRGDEEQEAFRRRFQESTQLRRLLEPAIAREVALHASDEDLRAIRACMDPTDFLPETFHASVMKALHNDVLMELFGRLSELENGPPQSVLRQPTAQEWYFECLQKQHIQIYDALLRRDGDAAYTLMLRHMEFVQQAYESYFSLFPNAPEKKGDT